MFNKIFFAFFILAIMLFLGCSNTSKKQNLQIKSFSDHETISFFGFPENNQNIFLANNKGLVKILNPDTLNISEIQLREITLVNTIAYDSISKTLYFGGNSKYIELYNAASFSFISSIETSYSFISHINLNDNKLICSGSSQSIDIYSITGKLLVQYIPTNADWINKAVLNSKQTDLYCWDSKDSVYCINYKKGITYAKIVIKTDLNNAVKEVLLPKSDNLLIFVNDTSIYFANIEQSTIDKSLDIDNYLNHVSYIDKINILAIFSNSLILYDTSLKKNILSVPLDFSYQYSSIDSTGKIGVFYCNNGELKIIRLKY